MIIQCYFNVISSKGSVTNIWQYGYVLAVVKKIEVICGINNHSVLVKKTYAVSIA